eukprot:GFUD01038639.1.p1 GENE.GFUD01038639.1~~GFUD01038639.1.p1  ORF type:complete len:134 (-),score=37.64 GFUD01038639.1:174-575(-)
MAGITQCEDFMLFQKALKKLREIDDKIIYALNQSTPTVSFQARGGDAHENCVKLRRELTDSHKQRGDHIKNCSDKIGDDIKVLRTAFDGGSDVRSELKRQQGKLRMFENELSIEDIIQERTEKIFKSKCQEFL